MHLDTCYILLPQTQNSKGESLYQRGRKAVGGSLRKPYLIKYHICFITRINRGWERIASIRTSGSEILLSHFMISYLR